MSLNDITDVWVNREPRLRKLTHVEHLGTTNPEVCGTDSASCANLQKLRLTNPPAGYANRLPAGASKLTASLGVQDVKLDRNTEAWFG